MRGPCQIFSPCVVALLADKVSLQFTAVNLERRKYILMENSVNYLNL